MSGAVFIPEVATDRLRLRAPAAADFDAVATFLASERTHYMGGPFDRNEAWRIFAANVGAWSLQGFGFWAVEERETGRLAGAVGFQHPPHFAEVELGWELYDGFEGQGYATEAAAAARDWWFGTASRSTVVSYIDPDNTRSARVAERLGACLDEEGPRSPDPEDLVYRHPRPETAQ